MILIALGANLPSKAGAPADTLNAALHALSVRGVTCEAVSGFVTTKAWPDPTDPPYVNAVARVATQLTPQALLGLLHETEDAFGRVRSARNAPRTLDLDIVDYDGKIEAGPPELPHPRLSERSFVLVPLKDVAPEWRHPVTGESVDALIAVLNLK